MESDESVLAHLGYKQEFKRAFSRYELFGLAFSVNGVIQGIASILVYSIPYGGPVSMVWGFLTGCIFIICIALSIAEMGSSAPTSGALYYWTFNYAPPSCRRYLVWLIGYVNSIGYIATVAAGDYACALAVLTTVTLGTDGSYVATSGHTYGTFCALLISHTILASLATKVLARIQPLYVLLNMGVFFAFIIALPIATPSEYKNTAKYALGHFENVSDYSDGFAFILSLLAPCWTICGLDSSIHTSEEAWNAPTAVPFAILGSVVVECVLGLAVVICLAFNMGTGLVALLSSPIEQPMAAILANSLGVGGTIAFWVFVAILLYTSVMDVLIASSRQVFAFSRDGALPLSSLFYNVNPYTGTPVNAVYMCVFIAGLLGLFSLAGSAAIGAIFTMSVFCAYLCYSTPIIARFFGGQSFTPGPFSLESMAFVATAFMILMMVVFIFPAAPAPVAESMNYTVAVVGGIITLATAYYFVSGRFWFTGPVVTVADGSGGKRSDEKLSIGSV
ncbi:related to UGA4-GABA permease-also involved in delta-aminolevulinate transport [Armillaria ostoyae]|uniref:Related to UGA4-GABA permease-also involved in delta-aminolevulinate transport n=1 Tax=Armillaria ostoyae TaxID=47428 RepID=A0A284S449_ARMOS|nr:related to UGA4-GABA permease-also involved in delta-aminolevulinate transport [Armillaria ostoyae]